VQISAVIITKDEEAKIGNAIKSVQWADEVLVVDSGSSDRTLEIAKNLGARVIEQEWLGFGKQKQFAVESANNDLIFSLDADEVVSPELANEIRQLASEGTKHDGYIIPRLAFYLGRPIRRCGWYPDHQLRLFDRRKGAWSESKVHESVQMDAWASVGKLNHDLLHYSIDSVAQHAEMIQQRYAPLSAAEMLKSGRSTSKFKIATLPIWTFFHTFVLRLGFLDGFAGLVISAFASYNVFLKHLLLYELKDDARNN
jgi:glycosyltransferase involved in cell wall biosynthesis